MLQYIEKWLYETWKQQFRHSHIHPHRQPRYSCPRMWGAAPPARARGARVGGDAPSARPGGNPREG